MTNENPRNSAVESHLPMSIDERRSQNIQQFIRRVIDDANANGVVVNLSGGIDSTVSATLATEALGSENVEGLILPAATNDDRNINDARQVAEELAINYRVLELQPLLEKVGCVIANGEQSFVSMDTHSSGESSFQWDDVSAEARGNVMARLRMLLAYFRANRTSKLVLGTGNRTELLLGYFTKYGDGGVDMLPIGDLYKTEVRELARQLGVREKIIEKKPTAGLWVGQSDESELGARYETIDAILHLLLDQDRNAEEIAAAVDVSVERVHMFAEMYRESRHKRTAPPTPGFRPYIDSS